MFSKTGLIAALAVCASAHADAAQWNFTWTGFHFNDTQVEYFDPLYSVSGTFSGIDTNHDDAITKDELTELTIGGRDYANCAVGPYVFCDIYGFHYRMNEPLTIVVSYQEWEYTELGGTLQTFQLTYDTDIGISYQMFGNGDSYTYYFTPETITTITPASAVPEPEAYAMFGVGMLLLAGATRRRMADFAVGRAGAA